MNSAERRPEETYPPFLSPPGKSPLRQLLLIWEASSFRKPEYS